MIAFEVHEDAVVLFSLPNTTVIQDILSHCSLQLSLCREQAFDGAANMQGKGIGMANMQGERNGVANMQGERNGVANMQGKGIGVAICRGKE